MTQRTRWVAIPVATAEPLSRSYHRALLPDVLDDLRALAEIDDDLVVAAFQYVVRSLQEVVVKRSSAVRALAVPMTLFGLCSLVDGCSDDTVTLPDERLDIPLKVYPTSGFPGHDVIVGVTGGELGGFCDLLAGLDMRTAPPTSDAEFATLRSELETVRTEAPTTIRNPAKRWSSAMVDTVEEAQAEGTAVSDVVTAELYRNGSLADADLGLKLWLTKYCRTSADN